MSSREVLRRLHRDGWFRDHQVGSHVQLRHALKRGTVTVPHPEKDIPIGTLKKISKQAGVPLP